MPLYRTVIGSNASLCKHDLFSSNSRGDFLKKNFFCKTWKDVSSKYPEMHNSSHSYSSPVEYRAATRPQKCIMVNDKLVIIPKKFCFSFSYVKKSHLTSLFNTDLRFAKVCSGSEKTKPSGMPALFLMPIFGFSKKQQSLKMISHLYYYWGNSFRSLHL